MTSNDLTLNSRPLPISVSMVRGTRHTQFPVSSSPPSHPSTLSVSDSSVTKGNFDIMIALSQSQTWCYISLALFSFMPHHTTFLPLVLENFML